MFYCYLILCAFHRRRNTFEINFDRLNNFFVASLIAWETKCGPIWMKLPYNGHSLSRSAHWTHVLHCSCVTHTTHNHWNSCLPLHIIVITITIINVNQKTVWSFLSLALSMALEWRSAICIKCLIRDDSIMVFSWVVREAQQQQQQQRRNISFLLWKHRNGMQMRYISRPESYSSPPLLPRQTPNFVMGRCALRVQTFLFLWHTKRFIPTISPSSDCVYYFDFYICTTTTWFIKTQIN